MKKAPYILCAVLAICLITSVLIICLRREDYKDQLQDKNAFENQLGEDYATPVINKTGDTPYYADKKVEDLEALYLKSSHDVMATPIMFPTGAAYQNSLGASGMPQFYFYNKLTGNISALCADPLCTHQLEECVWSDADIQYIGSDEIVFISDFDSDLKVYICDLQRNNIREIYDIAEYYEYDPKDGGYFVYSDMLIVNHVYDNRVYVEYKVYSENGAGMTGIYTIDLDTLAFELLYEIPKTVGLVAWIEDSVYYIDSSDPNNKQICRADLDLENKEIVTQGNGIAAYTDRYLVVTETKEGDRYPSASFVYDLQTKQEYDLPDNLSTRCRISGDYLYYTRNLTEQEMEGDPLKDYYTWKWEYKKKPMTAGTQGGGKIYRVRIGENAEECVLQLAYKDVPVRINNFTVDGEVIYFSYHHYEQFKNYLNQEFADSSEEPAQYAIADLQDGTVSVLDFSQAQ